MTGRRSDFNRIFVNKDVDLAANSKVFQIDPWLDRTADSRDDLSRIVGFEVVKIDSVTVYGST